MDIRQDDPNAPHVATLLAFHLSELRAVMSGEFAFALDARGLSEPGVTFWTVWIDDALAGFGALKRLDAGHAEVKSMRADPAFLGRGVGRAMMDHIVAAARADGYARLSLETGTAASHDAAVALYHRTGFVDCPPFADYRASPHNRFMTLAL
ncbi:GNAT family N-acetyltransferase [Sphingomonas sp. Leaf343]|uniref:GNAT family N-acetyltransferase n=1 Tax=Sphingomonas sp. Leaf343 TaxID=1736345 RepID=UPI0006F523FF|nr:GNAT family N-acetyltransferase [Sphingomonas sp. Leaf343]KQR83528.1 acyltransferase [Sphingomonas sp. Leaf343]